MHNLYHSLPPPSSSSLSLTLCGSSSQKSPEQKQFSRSQSFIESVLIDSRSFAIRPLSLSQVYNILTHSLVRSFAHSLPSHHYLYTPHYSRGNSPCFLFHPPVCKAYTQKCSTEEKVCRLLLEGAGKERVLDFDYCISLTTLSHSLDDVSSWSSQVEQVMTIEQLRDQMTSCFTCGVSWADDHVSLDCSECGGYAMRRPCPSCDGTCGSQWKRDLSMSHASSKAKWLGECSTTTTSNQQQQSAKDLEHREEQHQKKEVTTAVAAATTTTSAAAATATTTTTNRIAAQELCNRLEKLSATTNS